MTEAEFVARLLARWPTAGAAPNKLLALADKAVRACPDAAKLWLVRGNLLLPGTSEMPHPLAAALASYARRRSALRRSFSSERLLLRSRTGRGGRR